MSTSAFPLARVESLERRTLLSLASLLISGQGLGDTIGADAADPIRDVAYVYDRTTQHILAVSTDVGTTSAVAHTSANVAGLAVSIDGTRLFASEPDAFQIEVFNLPSMTLLKTLNVGVAVQQIVPVANDRIIGDTGQITGFDAETGATVFSMAGDSDGLLRTNVAGTTLYSRARGLSGNDGSIRVWNIAGTGNPVSETAIPGPTGENSTDFSVNPTAGLAYFGDGGVNGVEVTSLASRNQTFWRGQGPIENLAQLPGSPYVYAATSGGTFSAFDQYGVEKGYGSGSPAPNPESMVVTPNGNVLCTTPTGVEALGFPLAITQTPVLQQSITTLTASATTAPNGSGIIFTVAVAPSQTGASTPTGDVTIGVSSQASQGVSLINGSGQFTLSPPAGTYVVTATYNGDATYVGSSATPVTIVITPAGVGVNPSTVAITSVTPASAAFGSTVTFSGIVSSTNGPGTTPTGSVTLYSSTTAIGTTALQTNGLFTFATTVLSVGTDTITATYAGDPTYAASVSATAAVTVTPLSVNASVTTLASVTPNPSAADDMLVFRGSVASASGTGPVPTGLVALLNDGESIGYAALLSDGTFTFTYASLPAGVDTLSARYVGDTLYAASTSSTVSETVNNSDVAPVIGAAVLPASVVSGAKFAGKVPVTISNHSGDLNGKFTFNLYADTTPALDGTQTLIQSVSKSFLLKNGKTKAYLLKPRSLPASLTDGTYYVLAEVVDPTGTSTITALPNTVQVAAPFVALSATVAPMVPNTLVAGKPASVFVTVTNTGNTLATGSLAVTLSASVGGATIGTVTHSVRIKPGKTAKVKVRFTYDGSLAGGTYIPRVVVTLGSATTTATATSGFTV